MSDSLSQEEIDALLNGGMTESNTANEDASANQSENEQLLFDIIGEVGNISMSQAATALSSILNRRVSITTPRVSKIKFQEILDSLAAPKVATTVEFKEGLFGTNLMLLEVRDAIVIADLMMGGEGNPVSQEFTELELSAVAEAMNQMIGSASTSMATMTNRKVDIFPPNVNVWEEGMTIETQSIQPQDSIYKISFDLSVEGVIESEIMQIFSEEVVRDIENAMLADEAKDLRQTAPVQESTPQVASTPVEQPAPTPAPEPVASVQPTQTVQRPVEVSKPAFQTLTSNAMNDGDNLDLILDVPLDLSVILGRSKRTIKEILSLNTGSVIELDKLTEEPLEILLNGKLIATGEVVVINENFGVRITNILSQKQRISNLR